MEQIETGDTLGFGSKVYRGKSTANGILLKIHGKQYTTGYAALEPFADAAPEGTTQTRTDGVPEGFGVFYVDSKRNTIISNKTTQPEAVAGSFAGVLIRQPYMRGSFPCVEGFVPNWAKGLILKEGYLNYKQIAKAGAVAATPVNFDDIEVGWKFGFSIDFGFPVCGPGAGGVIGDVVNTAGATGNCIIAGEIIEKNFEDRSVTVKIG